MNKHVYQLFIDVCRLAVYANRLIENLSSVTHFLYWIPSGSGVFQDKCTFEKTKSLHLASARDCLVRLIKIIFKKFKTIAFQSTGGEAFGVRYFAVPMHYLLSLATFVFLLYAKISRLSKQSR